MSLAQEVGRHLPFLRRYARALTGSQKAGDAYVRMTLETLLAEPERMPKDVPTRVALYHVFHVVWSSTHPSKMPQGDLSQRDRKPLVDRLSDLTMDKRQALLLSTVEGFTHAEVAQILGRAFTDVPKVVTQAVHDLVAQTPTPILIIEDEPIISLELANIVEEMGHSVSAVATSHQKAVKAVNAAQPGLILSDIQLADDSSGVSAVAEILTQVDVPVIFITAFPERLLTGEGLEPTFLLTKPFARDSVKAAIGQALLLRDG